MPVNISAPLVGDLVARGARRGRARVTSTSVERGARRRSCAGPANANAGRAAGAEQRAARRTRRVVARGRRRATRAEQRAAALDERLQHAFATEQRERRVEIDAVPSAPGATISTLAPAARHASTAPRRGVRRW